MPAGGDKAQQIGRRNRGRAVVFERVVIERVVAEHRAVEHDGHSMVRIVGKGKGRDAARLDAERFVQELGVAEGKTRGGQGVGQPLQIDPAFLESNDEPERALLVLQEEALAMAARQLAAQLNRLGDREDRRMAIGFVGDAERVEASEQLDGSERRRSLACAGLPA